MHLISAELANDTITTDKPNYNLEGMVCPTFQNLGNTDVYFNGLLLSKNESFAVNVPTMVLTNTVEIRFADEVDRKVVVSFLKQSN